MAFRTITQLTRGTGVEIAPYNQGETEPTYYTIDSDNAASAGAGTLDLSLTTVDGAAAGSGDSVELEHDSELFLASNSTIAVDGAGTLGARTIDVDDAANGLPTNLVAETNFIKFAGHDQLYLVKDRQAGAAEYTLRLDPELKAVPADNEAVTVYNIVKLNLAAGVQTIVLTNSATTVPVTGVTYAMDATNTSLKLYATRRLLGLTDVSVTPTINSTTVTDMESSVNIQGSTTTDVAVTANEWPGNLGLGEVIRPLLAPGSTIQGVYFKVRTTTGKRVEDLASVTAAGGAGPVEAAETYNVTLSALRGGFYKEWTP